MTKKFIEVKQIKSNKHEILFYVYLKDNKISSLLDICLTHKSNMRNVFKLVL